MLDALYLAYQTLAVSAVAVKDSVIGRLTPERTESLIQGWAQRVLSRVRIRLDVVGADKVDWTRAYVIISNHQSHMDIPVLVAAIPRPVRYIAKKELFRIPIFGQAMRQAGIISIDRKDLRSAIASLDSAGESLGRGMNVWIAPEGTRSRDGRLLPLKKGGFVLAQNTGRPILPVALLGTRDIVAPGEREVHRDVTVRVVFGHPIEVEGVDRDALIGVVRDFLARAVEGDASVA